MLHFEAPDRRSWVGLGAMRLSTDRTRDEEAAIAVLHAAFDAGVTLVDTADAYCWDDGEVGRNERLIARALASWSGDRTRFAVATKGGLIRPAGRWVPDGRARHLEAACEASLRALGLSRLPLYQLHAPDPRVPFTTSVRALKALARDGRVGAVGLCNVTRGQIEEARGVVDVAAVQVELSLWSDASVLSGIVSYCLAHEITLLAYRPLGGAQQLSRVRADPMLNEMGTRHGVSAADVALAWVAGLSPRVVPLPGATRVDTARAAARAQGLQLTAADQAALATRFPAASAWTTSLRSNRETAPSIAVRQREVVLVMGLPAAGKSTLARSLMADSDVRLNRDEAGGTLSDLLPELDRRLASGAARVVLDNTYLSRASRAGVVRTARIHDVPVRCIWLTTGLEDAQINAVSRMIARHHRLLTPDEMRAASRRDVASFAPSAQFRAARALERPEIDEGFSRIDEVAFTRRRNPAFTHRAVMVWCDGVLTRSRSGRRTPMSPDDLDLSGAHAAVLRRWHDDGWRLLGLSWQPDCGDDATRAGIEATHARLRDQVGVPIEIEYCPHPAGPPACWCRKPLPGHGVLFIERHQLDPTRCLYVGAGPQDPGFARRLGFQYRDARDFFESPLSGTSPDISTMA